MAGSRLLRIFGGVVLAISIFLAIFVIALYLVEWRKAGAPAKAQSLACRQVSAELTLAEEAEHFDPAAEKRLRDAFQAKGCATD